MILPIVFSINNSYVKQLATVIVSVVDNYSGNDVISFNILHKNISEENIKILTDFCSEYKNIEINFINTTGHFNEKLLENLMFRRKDYKYISTETWYRFNIPDFLPNFDKVLYLDADMLVLDDIKKLFDTDINNYYAAAVHDSIIETLYLNTSYKINLINWFTFEEYSRQILHKKDNTYFNAGVILFNTAKMREDNVPAKLWNYAKYASPLEYQDQDVLNTVLEGNVKFIENNWNILKYDVPLINNKNNKTVSIIHFVDSNKPWVKTENYNNYNYKYIDEWWECYKKTPYYKEDDLKLYNYIKEMQNRLINESKSENKPIKRKLFSKYVEKKNNVINILGIKIKYKRNSEILKLEKQLKNFKEDVKRQNKRQNKKIIELSSRIFSMERQIVIESGLFDSEYYIKNYHPNLNKQEALDYYMTQGYKDFESPSEIFDAEKYEGFNNNINPILEYILLGRYNYAKAFWENKFPAEQKNIDKYIKIKKTRKTDKVLYTCITNNYDNLEEIAGFKYISPDFDYICFTDNQEHIEKGQVGIWEIRPLACSKYSDSINNRWHKIFPNLLFPEYKESVYIDGNINFLTSKFFDMIEKTKTDILLPEHPYRADIYKEIVWAYEAGYNTLEFSQNIASKFRDEGFPSNYGMTENNIIYRKHFSEDIIKMMQEWWEFMEEGANRDQVALAYIFWKHNRKIADYTYRNPRIDYKNYHIFVHKNERI